MKKLSLLASILVLSFGISSAASATDIGHKGGGCGIAQGEVDVAVSFNGGVIAEEHGSLEEGMTFTRSDTFTYDMSDSGVDCGYGLIEFSISHTHTQNGPIALQTSTLSQDGVQILSGVADSGKVSFNAKNADQGIFTVTSEYLVTDPGQLAAEFVYENFYSITLGSKKVL